MHTGDVTASGSTIIVQADLTPGVATGERDWHRSHDGRRSAILRPAVGLKARPHRFLPERTFHRHHYAKHPCRRRMEKSPLAQIEMSLSTVLVGESWADDGD